VLPWQRFGRRRDGALVVRLSVDELDLLGVLGRELRALLVEGDVDDPARRRLFPRAYLDPTEERAETEWQAIVGSDVLRERLERLEQLVAGTEATDRTGRTEIVLDAEGEAVWLGVLNDARLALGSRLGLIDDDDDVSDLPRDDPRAAIADVYLWLTALQAELIDVLMGS
jgi:hypothetical protein